MRRTTALAALAATATPLAATEQRWDFTLTPQSSLTADADATTAFTGSLLGNWDPNSNPDGTITRNGVFGGSGNERILFTGGTATSGPVATVPAGTFRLLVDTDAGTAGIAGLELDLLNGATPTLPIDLTLTYGNWRTIQPNSVYFAGTFTFPLGETVVRALAATGTADGTGTIAPRADGTYDLAVAAPVDLSGTVEINGQATAFGPVPGVVAITGVLAIGDATSRFSGALPLAVNDVQKGPIQGPVDQPIDIPTILPPGLTAHVLITTVLDRAALAMTGTVTLDAAGTPVLNRADWNGDGVVDSDDFFDFLNDFYAGNADFNGDGVTDSDDFFDFLNAFYNG